MDLLECLKGCHAEIIRAWMTVVRADLPEMRPISDHDLRDDFPLILDRIIHRLGGGERPAVMIEARMHAELRWQQGIGLAAIMREYQLLLQAIRAAAAERLGREMRPDEARTVDAVWFESVEQSVMSFNVCKVAELVQGNEHQDRLLESLAHDVRTPMQSITLTLALLEMKHGKGFDDEDRDQFRSVHAAINQVLDLHRGVLDHSKLEAGRVVLEETTFSIDEFLAGCVQAVKPLVIHKGLSVALELAAGTDVRTDRAVVEQVVSNLLSNAVRYTDEGGLTVRSLRTDSGIVVEVEDTGIGIRPEDQDRIFDEFYQARSPRRLSGEGYGLGLAIARREARLLGGDLTVRSEPGRGSVFALTLPSGVLPV
jgi:two-component system, sensor histidine kinase